MVKAVPGFLQVSDLWRWVIVVVSAQGPLPSVSFNCTMSWESPKAVAQLINSSNALGVSPGFSNRRGGTEPAVWRGGTATGQ
eukprot:5027682-Amphidinium_carterae.1